jgi:acetyl-CoA carboxylase biotin carboxyl carrier protein
VDFELNKIKDLIATLEKSTLRKLSLKKGDFEITLEKEEKSSPREYPLEVKGKKEEMVVVKEKKDEGKLVKSPMVGTFYTAPAPDQPPYVKIGDKVRADTVVCLIEAMKVMNEVKSGVEGVVTELLAENGKPVEFGSKLFRIL